LRIITALGIHLGVLEEVLEVVDGAEAMTTTHHHPTTGVLQANLQRGRTLAVREAGALGFGQELLEELQQAI
jgi:hypothetical protein